MNEFLSALFEGAEGYINIREIADKARNSFFEVGEKFEVRQDTNTYFGVFVRSSRSGKTQACTTTGALWADFDGVTVDAVRERIARAGLPGPSVWIDSGHGIHTYWLLNSRAGEEAVAIVKAIAKATGADSRPAHKAAVMRLPGSMNVKGEPVPCRVIEANWRRHDIADFERLLHVEQQRRFCHAVPELLDSNMACIRAAAYGVPEGHRNFWLGRITKFLQIRHSEQRAWQIVLAWNKLCRPAEKIEKLSADFKAYWHGPYKLLGCVQGDADRQAILTAYCAGAECDRGGTMGRLELDDAVSINNRIFGAYHKWTGNELILLALLLRHPEGLTTSALLEKLTARATGKPCMALNTMRKCLATLASRGLIRIVERNRQAGKEHFYRVIPQGTYGTGYTILAGAAVYGAIDGRVTSSEFRLYLLLLKFAYCKGACYPSLATLSKELRVDEALVSRQLKALEKADYIKRFYGYEGNDFKLIFRLLA
jgi:predicted transcriptional regulator